MHFDFDDAVALAGFAAAAFDVEGESADVVAAFTREGHAGEEFADGGEQAGVGGRVGARGAADRGLVDVDDFVEVFEAVDVVVWGGFFLGAVEFAGGNFGEGVVNQGGLAAAGYAGDAGNQASGSLRVTFLRLLPRAPLRMSIRSGLTGVRSDGTAMDFLPLRYCPVTDFSHLATFSGVSAISTLPPCSPAPGPISTTKSASRMASSSCSTTITLLPKSRRRLRVASRRSLSRWCRPMEGSSKTYITPVRPLPIWLARRMRWASPPERVSAERLKFR